MKNVRNISGGFGRGLRVYEAGGMSAKGSIIITGAHMPLTRAQRIVLRKNTKMKRCSGRVKQAQGRIVRWIILGSIVLATGLIMLH